MDETDMVFEKPESVENENAVVEGMAEVYKKMEAVADKKGEQHDGVKEMIRDKEDHTQVETQDMDVGEEKVSKEIDEMGEDEKEETKSQDMEEDTEEKTKNVNENKDEKEVDGVKKEEEILEEPNKDKGLKKRKRTKSSSGEKVKSNKKDLKEKGKELKTPTEKNNEEPKNSVDKKEEPKPPAASTNERPVRERKSVKRLVAAIEEDSAKEFHIEKGRGTALKDIPNVAYKLSRKKNDDTFKLLHTLLFGRRGKAAQVKTNISKFSGFVWDDDEEKQMMKVKEKLDKCVKEKLVEFCDVLDIPISKANMRKEDIIAKLIEFLVEPHATTSELIFEKEQSSKRKRVSNSASGSITPSKGSTKSRKKTESSSKKDGEKRRMPRESEHESGEEKKEAYEQEDVNGIPERSQGEMSEQAESEDKGSESGEESDEDKGRQKQVSVKPSSKKGSDKKAKTKKETLHKNASPSTKKAPAKPLPSRSNINKDTGAKKSPGMKKDESINKSPIPEKAASKESSGKKVLKVKSSGTKKDESINKSPTPEKAASKESSGKKVLKLKSPGTKKDESINKSPTSEKAASKESPGKKVLKVKSPSMKKDESINKSPTPEKAASKESPGKEVLKVKDKLMEEKLKPNDDDLRDEICEILRKVDFNTTTFTDIMKLLSKRFNTDLAPRKPSIKVMIQDELTKIANANEADEEEDEGEAEKNEKMPSTVGVKA